jgi:chitodextrinase
MRFLLACLLAILATPSPSAAGDTKPPTVPKGLTVTDVTANSVGLKWQASSDFKGGSGVVAYDVYRDETLVGSPTGLAYTDESVASATTYRYAVRARDQAGNVSVPSMPVSATTLGNACDARPNAPTGVQARPLSSSTVSLQWTAVTPPAGCAVSYNVYKVESDSRYSMILTGLLTTAFTVTGLQPSTSYTFSVSATDSVGDSGYSATASAQTAAQGGDTPGFPARVFAPYVDVLLWPTPSLTTMATESGSRYFSAGFIVAGSGCQATWGRHYTMSDGFLIDDISSLRLLGGDVIVSFGGAGGTELALACSTVEALRAQYQSVIDTYGVSRLDFDIEGNALGNTDANTRRAQAIARLEPPAGRTLAVQFTLPVMPSGLTPDGINLLQNALANGVPIAVVNVMAMDYGRNYTGSMGGYAVSAMNATVGTLVELTGKPEVDVRTMVGVTPMIGLNDVSPEVFTLGDADTLIDAAQVGGIGFLSFWSATRDRPCTRRQVVSPTCSGIVQSPWDFTNKFKLFPGY